MFPSVYDKMQNSFHRVRAVEPSASSWPVQHFYHIHLFLSHFIRIMISSKLLGIFSNPWLPPPSQTLQIIPVLLSYSLSIPELATPINYQPLGLLLEHKPWGWGVKGMLLHKWARFGCSYLSSLGIFHQNVDFLQKEQLTWARQCQHILVSKQKITRVFW